MRQLARAIPAVALLATAAAMLTGCTQHHSATASSSGSVAVADGAHDAQVAGDKAAPPAASAAAGAGGGAGGGAKAATGSGSVPLLADRSVIMTASITVRTGDIGNAVDAVHKVAADAGGLVYGEQVDLTPKESGKPGNASATVTLKVPPAKLGAVLDAVGAIGTEVSRTKDSADVTSKVVDVNARIDAARASIDRLTQLLVHAGNVSDLLAVEGQLSSRDAQLESLEQQQKTLQAQTGQATVTVHLEATPPLVMAAHKATTTPGFVRGLVGGWHAFTATVSGLATALGAVLPFLVVLGAIAVVVLMVRRRLRARHPQES